MDHAALGGEIDGLSISRSFAGRIADVACNLIRSRLALAGLLIVLAQTAMAVLAPVLAPYTPDAMHYSSVLHPPGTSFLFGTDALGRDILSRIMFGARLSLSVGAISVALALVVGIPLGLIAGYLGGFVDETIMRVLDGLMALPPLVLALTISSVLGSGLVNAMIAIAVVTMPTFARLMRGQVLSIKQNEYVQAAEAVGLGPVTIVVRHILPNAVNPVIVQAALAVGFAIITEASLSFIGLGPQPPAATWGSMVQVGFQYLEIAPWFPLAPAVMIFMAVLGFNMLGEGLRHVLNPDSRGRA